MIPACQRPLCLVLAVPVGQGPGTKMALEHGARVSVALAFETRVPLGWTSVRPSPPWFVQRLKRFGLLFSFSLLTFIF